MKTKKTLQELKTEGFKIGLIVGTLIGILFMIMAGVPLGVQINKLETKLSECQDEVPTCNVKYGYWGFNVVCFSDYFGLDNYARVMDQHHHKTLESCEGTLNYFIENENCEVLP